MPSLDARLRREVGIERRERSRIVFFERHPPLLRSRAHGAVARRALHRARLTLKRAAKAIALLGRQIRRRGILHFEAATPKVAICNVFGPYCREAISVAWCESRLQTRAQNGQYLGLFQMGSDERRLFGHGPTAHEQAVAAHKYFVVSGRDWSPWSCKPSRL